MKITFFGLKKMISFDENTLKIKIIFTELKVSVFGLILIIFC